MNHSLSFSQAVEGYLLAAQARRLSEHTLFDYINTFRKFQAYLEEVGLDDDPPIASIQAKMVESFLASQRVSKKTVLNYHIGLSALWTWAVAEGLVKEHILHKVERARPEERSIVPYSESDVKAMLGALGSSKLYTRPGKKESSHSLPHTERNRAILLLLLDTGMRASELCDLRIHQVDTRNRRVKVFGKGSKERMLPFSSRTGQALWRYLALRGEEDANSPLFVTGEGRPMDRDQLLKAVVRIGERAGVVGTINVHRFRHTFAINYLRNGGDSFSLQMMLGHTTMEMVQTYLALAQADLDNSHKRASPVENWRL